MYARSGNHCQVRCRSFLSATITQESVGLKAVQQVRLKFGFCKYLDEVDPERMGQGD